jgi:hypothetical protein
MTRSDIAVGEKVWFRLDGKSKGKGLVGNRDLEEFCDVVLTEPCKEYVTGQIIRVGYDEIYCVFKHQN